MPPDLPSIVNGSQTYVLRLTLLLTQRNMNLSPMDSTSPDSASLSYAEQGKESEAPVME